MCPHEPDTAPTDGHTIEVFSDLNLSGKNTDRPRYQDMLRRVDAGDLEVVTAYELSRITRDSGDHAEFFKRLERKNVRFISAREHVDPSTPESKFNATILTGSNQLQREQTQRRVKDSLARKVERGEPVGRLLPGYKRVKSVLPSGAVKTTIELDPATAEGIRVLFREYASGSHSFVTLAEWMNQQGYPVARTFDQPKSTSFCNKWESDKVKAILSNERFTGLLRRSDGKVFKATAYPPLIDDETWNACVLRRMAGRSSRLRTDRVYRSYPLSALLRCGRCGATVSGVHRKFNSKLNGRREYSYYECYGHRQRFGCDQPQFRQAETEAAVVRLLEAMVVPGLAEAVEAAVGAYATQQRRVSRTERRKRIEGRLANLRELFELGDIGKDEYLAKKAALLLERDALDAAPTTTSVLLQRQRLTSAVEDWPRMTGEERKRVLRLIFQEIRADHGDDGRLVVKFKPRPEWESYIDAVLAKIAVGNDSDALAAIATSERETVLRRS